MPLPNDPDRLAELRDLAAEERPRLFMLTASFVSPDDTDTPHDVLAAAEVNGVHEVYPEHLTPAADFGPAWIEPQAAAVLTTPALAMLLDALEVGIEGGGDWGPDAAYDQVVLWVQTMRANITLDAPA
jgi:hypothetical protein